MGDNMLTTPDWDAIRTQRVINGQLRADERRQLRRQRRCFWAWPWGHTWSEDGSCVGCGKVSWDGEPNA